MLLGSILFGNSVTMVSRWKSSADRYIRYQWQYLNCFKHCQTLTGATCLTSY